MDLMCCIPICRNAKTDADQSVGFHPFPPNPELRKTWIEFVGVDSSKFRWRGKYICSEHFLHSEIIEENCVKKLLEGAVPMVFCPEEDNYEDEYFVREDVMTSNDSTNFHHSQRDTCCLAKPEEELRNLFCRICLRKQSELLPFSSKLHNATITDIIYVITGLDIQTDILVPTKICSSCVAKLDLAFSVRIEVIHNDKKLKNLLRSQQLTNHYQFYDKKILEKKSSNEEYLDNLVTIVKNEISAPPLDIEMIDFVEAESEIKIESAVEQDKHTILPNPLDTEHGSSFEQERFYDRPILINNESDTVLVTEAVRQPIPAFQFKTEPSSGNEDSAKLVKPHVEKETERVSEKERDNFANISNQLVSEIKDKKEPSKKQFVFSWKELYKPKAPTKPKRNFEQKPKPVLVPHTCYICKTSFKDADELESHMEQHVGLLPFTCEECHTVKYPQVFKSLFGLNKHLRTHLYPYKCGYCPSRFARGESYTKHVDSHEGNQGLGFTCDVCGRQFARKKTLAMHLSKHRAMEEGTFTCEYCGKMFNCNSLLKRHLRIHTGEKPFECKKCGRRFNHEANFQSHKRRHIGERAHHCTECDKSFICGTTLRYHMATHFPGDPRYRIPTNYKRSQLTDQSNNEVSFIKEYACDVPKCDFVSNVYREYFYHKNVHRKRFQCETCQKRFPFKSSLTRHIMLAHEHKSFPKTLSCSYCPKMFNCRQKLKVHIDGHEDNRRYKCSFCEKSFVQKNNCTTHEKIHTGERPHVCRFCPAAFISSSGRKKHEKTHPEANVNEDIQNESKKEVSKNQTMDFSADETGGLVDFTPLYFYNLVWRYLIFLPGISVNVKIEMSLSFGYNDHLYSRSFRPSFLEEQDSMDLMCCIPICHNAKAGADQNVGFHPFPPDPQLRKVWMEFVGVDASKFRWRGKYICSEHFLLSELIEEKNEKKLLEGAVPMIFAQDEDDEDEYVEREDVMISNNSTRPSNAVSSDAYPNCDAIESEIELRTQFCRICLRKRFDLLPFSSKLHNATLTDIIYTISGLKIQMDAIFPTKICNSCVAKLDLAFNVRIELIQNDIKLKNLLRGKQLIHHYTSYDKHRYETKSVNEDYLDNLITTVKNEISDPLNIDLGNHMSENGNPKANCIGQIKKEAESLTIMRPSVPVVKLIDEEHLHVGNIPAESVSAPKSVVTRDVSNENLPGKIPESPSELESSPPYANEQFSESEDENVSNKKQFVYSWKELYTPKTTSKPKRFIEYKPKPVFVPHTCYACKTSYKDADELDSHMEEHVNLLPFTCEECNTEEYPQVFKSLYSLNKHLQSHLYPYKCDYCPASFVNSYSFSKHIDIHEGTVGDGFTCDSCGKHFTQKRSFASHLAKHRALAEGTFTCEYCGKIFNSKPLLKRHLRIHTGERPYECKKCGKKFNHEANFQNHKRTHTGERAHRCTECDKSFLCGSSLRYHMAVHFPGDPRFRMQPTGQRPRYSESTSRDVSSRNVTDLKEYTCDVPGCGFVSNLYRSYFYHKSKHQKRFQCEMCDKRFAIRSCLAKHILIAHENKQMPKTKPCPLCPKMFSSRQKLNIHIDVHQNNRKYKCRFCEKSFVQKSNCISHEKIHTGERPHACRYCAATFISSSGKKKHEKTHPEANMKEEIVSTSQDYSQEGNCELEDQMVDFYVDVREDAEAEDLVEYSPL
ncbi:uncharacterized protein LOC131429149 [Malaya genurostris]|uniref:uncharacterized protein LOC131429149 n=1 Tax=Malaya genurostris TaxID=325434 RepID=UPI0026F3912E|nr:uncharacterized protein LOC131429149 [Malaya genurostris]